MLWHSTYCGYYSVLSRCSSGNLERIGVADLDFSKGGELYISACDVNSGCEEGTTITWLDAP